MTNPKFLRLDELAAKPDHELTEAEGAELESLAHLLVDPAYIEHHRALLEGAGKPH